MASTRRRRLVQTFWGILLKALIGVMSGAELSFKLEPSDIIAVQEQPLMLHCQVDGIPPITTQWRHDGLLVPQDRHHTTFINGSLLVAHFQKTKSDGSSDEGDYECMAQNSFGRVVSRKARIQAATGIRNSYYQKAEKKKKKMMMKKKEDDEEEEEGK